MIFPLIDTHAHLDFQQYDSDRDDVIRRAQEVGVGAIVNVGVDLASSRASVQLAEAHQCIYAAVGIHPHDAKGVTADTIDELRELAAHPKVVAIGEIGLDFYRNLSDRETQISVFTQLLRLAKERALPVIIHMRNASDQVLSILRAEEWPDRRGVFHCFSGDSYLAREVLDMGFHISFTGNITFKNSRALEVLKTVPLERLFLETDCPFMAPEPHRGQRNEPAYLRLIGQKIAQVKGCNLEEVTEKTTQNATALFGIDLGRR